MTAKNDFKEALIKKIQDSLFNNYDDNYDEYRFGPEVKNKGIKELIRKKHIYPNYIPKWEFKKSFEKSNRNFC